MSNKLGHSEAAIFCHIRLHLVFFAHSILDRLFLWIWRFKKYPFHFKLHSQLELRGLNKIGQC